MFCGLSKLIFMITVESMKIKKERNNNTFNRDEEEETLFKGFRELIKILISYGPSEKGRKKARNKRKKPELSRPSSNNGKRICVSSFPRSLSLSSLENLRFRQILDEHVILNSIICSPFFLGLLFVSSLRNSK